LAQRLLIGLIAIIFVTCCGGFATWDRCDITNYGEYPSMTLDKCGQQHISYYTGTIKYAYWNGWAWVTEVVDADEDVGYYSSIATDANNRPHIVYCNTALYEVKYARKDDSGWQISILDDEGEISGAPSIAIDHNNNPHVCYYNLSLANLMYAYWDGSNWQITPVDYAEDVGYQLSLKLDSNDHPHIAYYDSTNQDLKYATWNGSSWQFSYVDSPGNVGWYPSLAIDSSNRPHISYFEYIGSYYTTGRIKYAYWNGSTWQIQAIADGLSYYGYSSLALNENNMPRILYVDNTDYPEKLIYAEWDGSGWQKSDIGRKDRESFNISSSSLVINSLGNPCIAYETYYDYYYPLEYDEYVATDEIPPRPVNFVIASIIPNPASTQTSIVCRSLRGGEIKLSIFDLTGRLVKKSEETANLGIGGLSANNLDVSGLARGVYVVKATLNGEIASKRLVISR